MEFPSNFLNVFLAATTGQSDQWPPAFKVHPTSLITIDNIIPFISALPYLECLYITWMIDHKVSEEEMSSAFLSNLAKEINLNLRSLGYPYEYNLDAEAIVSVLKVVDMVFPSFAHHWIFSYYMNDWNDAIYHMGQAVGFFLKSFNVLLFPGSCKLFFANCPRFPQFHIYTLQT